jgi:hypothetical protein
MPSAYSEQTFSGAIFDRLEVILRDAERETKPLEVQPYRGQLFELFVTAHGAGKTNEGADGELAAEAVCRELALRWGLTMAARDAAAQQAPLPPDQLGKMRLLWSLLRMWMEWTYAWDRWADFHPDMTPETN